MVFLFISIPGISAAQLPPHGLFIVHDGNVAPVIVCGVGVCVCGCAKEKRDTLYDEAFLWKRCQIELRILFEGATVSHGTDLLGVSVCVGV